MLIRGNILFTIININQENIYLLFTHYKSKTSLNMSVCKTENCMCTFSIVATTLSSPLCLLLSKAWEPDNWSQRMVQRKEVRRGSLELLQNFCCVSRKLQTFLSCGDEEERVPRTKAFQLRAGYVICQINSLSLLNSLYFLFFIIQENTFKLFLVIVFPPSLLAQLSVI